MLRKQRHPMLFIANILIFAAVILFETSQIADISIKNATPMLILPLLTAYAFFFDVKRCVVAGIITGALVDSVSHGAYCFNTLALMLLTVAVCLASNNLFNKNIRAAVVLSLLTALIYFVLLWLFFYCFGIDIKNSLSYLLKYAIPSAVYSAVFVFPFYFIYKKFKEIKEH